MISNLIFPSFYLFSNFRLLHEFLSYWKLKEMVLAILSELDSTLTDDAVDSIVDKVSKSFNSYDFSYFVQSPRH